MEECPTKQCRSRLEDIGAMFYCLKHDQLLEDEEIIIFDLVCAEENRGFYCTDCRHLRKDKISCKAFPEVIPEPFLAGTERHTEPKYGQKNKIIFERKK